MDPASAIPNATSTGKFALMWFYRFNQVRVPFIAAPMRHDHHAKTEIVAGTLAFQYSSRLARGKPYRNRAD